MVFFFLIDTYSDTATTTTYCCYCSDCGGGGSIHTVDCCFLFSFIIRLVCSYCHHRVCVGVGVVYLFVVVCVFSVKKNASKKLEA